MLQRSRSLSWKKKGDANKKKLKKEEGRIQEVSKQTNKQGEAKVSVLWNVAPCRN
jgi:choline kinase